MEKRDRVASITYLLVGFAVIFYALKELGMGTIKLPGPGFFPVLCGVSIVVFSGIWLFSLRNGQSGECPPFWGKGEWIRPAIAVALTTAYATIMDDLGFIPSTFLFLTAWQLWVERERWVRNMVISLIGTAAMYTIFQVLLSVPLPRGMFSM